MLPQHGVQHVLLRCLEQEFECHPSFPIDNNTERLRCPGLPPSIIMPSLE
jgi:hypothetical protein